MIKSNFTHNVHKDSLVVRLIVFSQTKIIWLLGGLPKYKVTDYVNLERLRAILKILS